MRPCWLRCSFRLSIFVAHSRTYALVQSTPFPPSCKGKAPTRSVHDYALICKFSEETEPRYRYEEVILPIHESRRGFAIIHWT